MIESVCTVLNDGQDTLNNMSMKIYVHVWEVSPVCIFGHDGQHTGEQIHRAGCIFRHNQYFTSGPIYGELDGTALYIQSIMLL